MIEYLKDIVTGNIGSSLAKCYNVRYDEKNKRYIFDYRFELIKVPKAYDLEFHRHVINEIVKLRLEQFMIDIKFDIEIELVKITEVDEE